MDNDSKASDKNTEFADKKKGSFRHLFIKGFQIVIRSSVYQVVIGINAGLERLLLHSESENIVPVCEFQPFQQ